jgi:hypothetical protein
MNDRAWTDPREPRGSGAPRRPVEPGQALRTNPDRLVRVLAEGLRSIEERRAREQTERRNRAIIVARMTEEPSDEPAQEP